MFTDSHFLNPLFWIVMGVLYTLAVAGFRYYAQDKNISMNWWKWLLLIIWFGGLSITIAGAFTLIGENEARAGMLFLGLFGTFFIILGVGLFRLLRINK